MTHHPALYDKVDGLDTYRQNLWIEYYKGCANRPASGLEPLDNVIRL